MTPDDLRSWRETMGLTRKDAAKALGVSYRAYIYMEDGVRDGKPVGPDLRTALACAALYHRLEPWTA